MNHIRYERLAVGFFIALITLSIILISNSTIARAGGIPNIPIVVDSVSDLEYTQAATASPFTSDLTTIYWKTGTYNYISDFRINDTGGYWTFKNTSKASEFTITAGGTGGGFVYYNGGINENITWVFNSDATMTSSPLTLSYTDTSFVPSITWNPAVAYSFTPSSQISDAKPVLICVCSGATYTQPGNYQASMSSRTTDYYNITYPTVAGTQYFDLNVTKGIINTKHNVTNWAQDTVIMAQPTFSNTGYELLQPFPDGLKLNVSVLSGAYTIVFLNASGASIPASPNNPANNTQNGVGIAWSSDNYELNTAGNLSWIKTTPLLSCDNIKIYNPNDELMETISSPADTGFFKLMLGTFGMWKAEYNREDICFVSDEAVLNTAYTNVTPTNPSYILANETVPSGIAFNASYLFGYTPPIQGELNSIKIERIDLQDITYYSTVSLNNTAIAANTEYNISLTISGLGRYKLSLFDISRGFVASTIVQTVEVPIPIERNITTSYISTDLDTYFKGDNLQISYGIDNTNFSFYPEKYIKIIHSSGAYPETGRQLTTKQEDIINIEITEVSTWFKWFSGVNYVELHAKNSTTDILIVNTSFTLAFIDSDGYGLEVSPTTLCPNQLVNIKTSSPASTLFNVDVYQKSGGGNKIVYYQNYVNGSNKTRTLKLVFEGEYFFNLYDTSNASRFVKSVKVDNGNCGATPTPTGTQTPPASTIGTNIMNFATTPAFWGLIIWILAVFGVASTGKNGEDRSKAIELVAVIAAALEVILGLWHPFTWWVVAILIIALGAKFYAGRQLTRDG